MRRPRPAVALLATGTTLVVGSALLGFVAGAAVRSPSQVLADTAAPRPTVLTEAVTAGTATRTVAFDGKVERRYLSVVAAPAVTGDSASSVVTRLPVREGDTVRAGGLVAEVNGRPVLVLAGRIPAFRALAPGAHGRDVRQLQDGLRAAGFAVSDAEGDYGASTARAVEGLYERHGYEPLAVGEAEVEAATSAVRESQRSWEQTRSAGDRTATRYAAEDLDRARAALAAAQSAAGAQVPFGEVVFVPSLPARVFRVDATAGSSAATSLLQLAAGPLVVRGAPLEADLAGLRPAAPVELLLSRGGSASGRVGAITTEVAAGDDESPSRSVTVLPTKTLDARAGEPVRIVVTVAQSTAQGLLVPVSAVTSAPDGSTYVTVLTEGRRREVAVSAGFMGDGVVQVTPAEGDRLALGERVVVGLGG